jgi:hypothetical protein
MTADIAPSSPAPQAEPIQLLTREEDGKKERAVVDMAQRDAALLQAGSR